MKQNSSTLWSVFALMAFLPLPASAYIDPGTGSALFYVVTGVIVSLYFGVRGAYYRVLEYALRGRHRHQSCELAIHCEDPRYETSFLPVIRELARRDIELSFFTMYERDSGFEKLPAGVTHHSIQEGLIGYAYLNHLEATVLVTTTPQLDVMTFRRSPRVRHYVMLQHALGESRFVRPYAYDYFDTVLCCGPILKNNIQRMECLRQSPKKALLETGLPHYEALISETQGMEQPKGETVVLIAPSWGPLSMFEEFGTSFVAEIARNFQVIVRPHPQMKVSQPELYAEVLALDGVEVDTARAPAKAMARADILLSDISGISHEFAFLFERPAVVIDRKARLGGLEGELLGGESEIKQHCSEFIVPVDPAEIHNISFHLKTVLANYSVDSLKSVRENLIYNFGSASSVAANQIEKILQREQTEAAQASESAVPAPTAAR